MDAISSVESAGGEEHEFLFDGELVIFVKATAALGMHSEEPFSGS